MLDLHRCFHVAFFMCHFHCESLMVARVHRVHTTYFLVRALELDAYALCSLPAALYLCHQPTLTIRAQLYAMHFSNMHFSMILTFIIVFIVVGHDFVTLFFVGSPLSTSNIAYCIRVLEKIMYNVCVCVGE